ncbi:unnamed protein product [Urochloa humidicola]
MRRPNTAAATIGVLVWLAVLTVAFHGCGRRLGCGGLLVMGRTGTVAVPASRKMLLAAETSFNAAAHSANDQHHRHRHHHHQHHHQHRHVHRWNRQGIPPSVVGNGEELDPRYGVQKRMVPTGPNPLHH